MARTILDKYSRPKRDPIKALINERVGALGVGSVQLADYMGLGRTTASARMVRQHTEEWPLGEVRRLCQALRVEIEPNEAATICRSLGITIREKEAKS